jgi:hypothetical protein
MSISSIYFTNIFQYFSQFEQLEEKKHLVCPEHFFLNLPVEKEIIINIG